MSILWGVYCFTIAYYNSLMVVISINTQERIRQLMEERGWSEYRLAKECGVSQSTISNIFNRNYQPSIASLENICGSFGITLSQFSQMGISSS